MREISEKEGATLKGVTARGLKLAGGAGVVQHSTRVNEASLSKYASMSTDNEKTFVPIDVAVEIDRLAESPVIVAAMAEALGYELAPLHVVNEVVLRKPLTVRDALKIANEAADVVKAITDALADDEKIDSAEERIITREIDEAIKVMQDALFRVKVRT